MWSLQSKEERTMLFSDETQPLGVYCHVPFCPGGCDFCSFYRTGPRRSDVVAFLDGIAAEIALTDGPIAAETVFFGGGTPGLLATEDLLALCRTILARLGGPPREWTVEMAPTTVKAEKMKALKEIGVTRISMGIQSFDADLLRTLGRRHSPERSRAAFDLIRDAGFDNVNVDMIFALPGQTGAELDADLAAAVGLGPEHISTYCLTLEEGTPLRERVLSRSGEPDPDREAELFLRTWDRLGEAGFGQYEISNFSLPGRECRHNVNTWRMGEWVGLGPSAASQLGGRRRANPAGLEEWLHGVLSGRPVRVDEVPLTARLLAEDAIVFGLRMNAGLRLDHLRRRFHEVDFAILEPLWSDLQGEGIVAREGSDHVALTRKGRLLADRIGVAVLDRFEEASLSARQKGGLGDKRA
jgi:oxygen-independent coproporphyrinogen III oxidase